MNIFRLQQKGIIFGFDVLLEGQDERNKKRKSPWNFFFFLL